jgi:DNA-binding NarL/FixJ family response regulator
MSITVFIADDHAVVRDGLRLLLEEQNDIKVIGEAANGRDAVSQVTQLCPDVAIIDIAMPEQNGIEATQKICEACTFTLYALYYRTHLPRTSVWSKWLFAERIGRHRGS